MTLCYPFRKKVGITCDWKEAVVFNGLTIAHSGQDTSNIQLHLIAEREKNTDYLHVLAMANGEVRQVKEWGNKGSLGWGVQIYYPELDTVKLSLHLKGVLVKVGQKVKLGQPIAVIGVGKNQTITEHTHEAYEKGDRLSSGLMGNYTQNPYNYTKQMKLLSVIEKPPVIVIPTDLPKPPVEATVSIPESVWKAMVEKNKEDDQTIITLHSMSVICKKEKDVLNETVLNKQIERDVLETDIQRISTLLGTHYESGMEWSIQKFKYEVKIALLKENALENSTIRELLRAVLDKFSNK